MINSTALFHPDTNYLHKRVSLVKRQPFVRTPTWKEETKHKKKTVRFRDNASLEHVRLFLKTQMPKACRADPCSYYTYQLHTLNWPVVLLPQANNTMVQLEHIELFHQDSSLFLLGSITVANVAFEKQVEIRYSLDQWATARSIQASYKEPVAHSTRDRFHFKLSLPVEDTVDVQLAVRYTVANQHYWDNNQKANYKFKIIPDIDPEDISSSSDEEDDNKSLSPPLSPTTPVDTNPLYFHHQQKLSSFIHNYCFYNPLYDLTQKVIHTS